MMANESIVGNKDLFSVEEEYVVEYLRRENLFHANEIAQPVFPKDSFYTRYIKRMLDILISFPLVIILFPLNSVFAICTFFDVGHPIFYRQTRIGRYGKKFTMVKFRSMNEKKDEYARLLPPAQRVTKFGRIMRKYSLDELLNFWSVLKGDMSIIGPRPAPVFIYERMTDRHKQRTALRPGLECPRIINVSGHDLCKYHQTYENDIWYVENVSFMIDLKMCYLLAKMVFDLKKREGQAKGQGVSYFIGYDKDGYAISMNKYKERNVCGIENSLANGDIL